MKKGKIFVLVGVILLVALTGLLFISLNNSDKKEKTDSLKFKEEYEKLNDTYAFGDIKYSSLDINEGNPFVYASDEEVIDTLKNGTGIIYFGYPKCPWCRNAVNVLQHLNVDKILYFDAYEHRDTYEVKDGTLVKSKDGTDTYYELLKLLDEALLEYEIEKDGVKYNAGEKRLYVPMVVGVKDGKIVASHIDVVDLEEGQNAFDMLTKKQQEQLLNIYNDIKSNVYDDACNFDSEHGC